MTKRTQNDVNDINDANDKYEKSIIMTWVILIVGLF